MMIVEILGKIEETRLVLADKILKNSRNIGDNLLENFRCKIKDFSSSKYFLSFSCFLIILLSIFVRSSRDIGYESALYIDIAQKILAGGKYYYDFFDYDWPLAFYLTTIPVYFAGIFNIEVTLFCEIFMNFVGILSIFLSYKIIVLGCENSCKIFAKKKAVSLELKLIIIGFCAAWFLRIYVMQFNEYLTKSSWFLAFLFPFVSCNFCDSKNSVVKFAQGALSALITCLNPIYFVLIFGFGLLKDGRKMSIFSLNNLVFITAVVFYLLWMIFFAKEYFLLWLNYDFSYPYFAIFNVVKSDIFVVLLLVILHKNIFFRARNFRILMAALLFYIIILLSGFDVKYDSRFVVFGLFFTLFLVNVKEILQTIKIHYLVIFAILVILQFDAKSSFGIFLDSVYFWWILLFFTKERRLDLIALGAFCALMLVFNKNANLLWLFCAAIFLFGVNFGLFFKQSDKIWQILTLISISYLLSLFLAAIFNHQNLYAKNKISDDLRKEKIEIVKKYAPKIDDKVMIISDEVSDSMPILSYFGKKNEAAFYDFSILFKDIKRKEKSRYPFADLKKQIIDKNNKLIFVKKNHNFDDRCAISFLEYYLQDREFRNIFINNYVFIDEIYDIDEVDRVANFYEKKITEITLKTLQIKTGEFEVYRRINN